MRTKATRLTAISAAAAALALAGSMQAQATTTFDQTLALPATGAAESWYNGSGNPQGGFTVATDNGIELGLRAKLRQSPNVIHTSNNVYTVQTGLQDPGHALWNYEFSIDLGPNGGNLTFGEITAEFFVSKNGGAPTEVDPLTHWTDDSFYGSTGKIVGDPNAALDWGAQNSENPLFADFPLGAFDPSEIAQYTFTLDIKDAKGTILDTDSIIVNAVPEPATLALFGVGLLGLGVLRRRKSA